MASPADSRHAYFQGARKTTRPHRVGQAGSSKTSASSFVELILSHVHANPRGQSPPGPCHPSKKCVRRSPGRRHASHYFRMPMSISRKHTNTTQKTKTTNTKRKHTTNTPCLP